jgi:hypothetical protein
MNSFNRAFVIRNVVALICGLFLTALAIPPAMISAGAGHGSYRVASLLFPMTVFLAVLGHWGVGAITIAICQFSFYSLLLANVGSNKRYSVLAVILVVHLLGFLLLPGIIAGV